TEEAGHRMVHAVGGKRKDIGRAVAAPPAVVEFRPLAPADHAHGDAGDAAPPRDGGAHPARDAPPVRAAPRRTAELDVDGHGHATSRCARWPARTARRR